MSSNEASQTKCHSDRIRLDFQFGDFSKRYNVKTHQKLDKSFKKFCGDGMHGHLRENVKFLWKGREIFGHETVESKKLKHKDKIVAVVSSLDTDQANVQLDAENVRNSDDKAKQNESTVTHNPIVNMQDEELEKPKHETLKRKFTPDECDHVKTNEPESQQHLKLPAKKMCDNSTIETNAEKLRRLRPAVDRFLHWKLCEATFMTDTIPATPKLGIDSTKLKAEVIVLKESMAQMEIEHANELLAKNRVIGELQKGFDENLEQSQVARDEITKLNEELRQKELNHAAEIEMLQKDNKKLMESVRNRNDNLEKEIAELKMKHANEVQNVKNEVTESLQKQFNEKLKQYQLPPQVAQPASPCSSETNINSEQRPCTDCGGRSKLKSTFAYCNSQCKQNYLKKLYGSIPPMHRGA